MITCDNLQVPELLPPHEDGVFKTLLTHEDAKPILRDIVESYLRCSVTDVVVRNVELPISDINKKRERFDVNCTIDDGTQLGIEMQACQMSGDSLRTNHRTTKNRAIYYLSVLHSGQSGRNVKYDKLMRSFQMTFCGYTVFPDRDDFVSRFSFRDENNIELSDAVGLIFIELSKLKEVLKRPVSAMTREEAWAVFFAHASNAKHTDLINKLIAERKEIKMAKELLQTISRDEIERAHFLSRRMFEMDQQHNFIVAREEGLAEGRAVAKAEVAKNLKQLGTMTTEEIANLTGLTQSEVECL